MITASHGLALNQRPVLVVDNGSYEFRAGWATNPDGSSPDQPFIRERNQVARPKTLINRDIDSINIVGDQFNHFDASKLHKRATFDKNVVTHITNVEDILDYCFSHLGVSEQI